MLASRTRLCQDLRRITVPKRWLTGAKVVLRCLCSTRMEHTFRLPGMALVRRKPAYRLGTLMVVISGSGIQRVEKGKPEETLSVGSTAWLVAEPPYTFINQSGKSWSYLSLSFEELGLSIQSGSANRHFRVCLTPGVNNQNTHIGLA